RGGAGGFYLTRLFSCAGRSAADGCPCAATRGGASPPTTSGTSCSGIAAPPLPPHPGAPRPGRPGVSTVPQAPSPPPPQKQTVRDRARFGAAASVLAVAPLAERAIRRLATVHITSRQRLVRGQVRTGELVDATRARADPSRQRIDLLLGQRAAGPLGERRHRR